MSERVVLDPELRERAKILANLATRATNASYAEMNARKLSAVLQEEEHMHTISLCSRSSSIGLSYFILQELSSPVHRDRRKIGPRGGTMLQGKIIGVEQIARKSDSESKPRDYLVMDLAEEGDAGPELCYLDLGRVLEGCYID